MNFNLCKYKDIFGKSKEGVHSLRIFDIAVVDVVGTILGAYFISQYLNLNFYQILIILFLLGIILHHLFCVRTTVDKILFPE
jgi:uncharacterized membrane protein YcaP (DUF421 family)